MVAGKRSLSTLYASVSSSTRSMKASGFLWPVKLSPHRLTSSMTGLVSTVVGAASDMVSLMSLVVGAVVDRVADGPVSSPAAARVLFLRRKTTRVKPSYSVKFTGGGRFFDLKRTTLNSTLGGGLKLFFPTFINMKTINSQQNNATSAHSLLE
uniref:Uncharacterized protein n=1 Tax=Glossina austeni TaxID=7395 RepID=A0A1A9VB54_GLOAU